MLMETSKTRTSGLDAQSALRALARAGMKIDHIEDVTSFLHFYVDLVCMCAESMKLSCKRSLHLHLVFKAYILSFRRCMVLVCIGAGSEAFIRRGQALYTVGIENLCMALFDPSNTCRP